MTKNKTSEMILEQKVRNQLDALYHAFDADNNGFISADEINLDNVSAKILEIFTPLFVEMESLGEALSKVDFAESAYELYKVSPRCSMFATQFALTLPLLFRHLDLLKRTLF